MKNIVRVTNGKDYDSVIRFTNVDFIISGSELRRVGGLKVMSPAVRVEYPRKTLTYFCDTNEERDNLYQRLYKMWQEAAIPTLTFN